MGFETNFSGCDTTVGSCIRHSTCEAAFHGVGDDRHEVIWVGYLLDLYGTGDSGGLRESAVQDVQIGFRRYPADDAVPVALPMGGDAFLAFSLVVVHAVVA